MSSVKTIPSIAHPYDPKAHHTSKGFKNPWPSAGSGVSLLSAAKTKWNAPAAVPVPEDPKLRPVQVIKPSFQPLDDELRATWLGHASWLLQFPGGINVLTDPLFSDRTSPVTFMGPKRYSQPPCSISDLPHSIIVLSHNHYDHTDLSALQAIWQQQRSRQKPTFVFVPLGMRAWILNNLPGTTEQEVHELDWWEGRQVGDLMIYCTPAQHGSARTPTDKDVCLWSSWTFRHIHKGKETTCFFAGDTGYRSVPLANATPLNPPSPFPGDDQLRSLPTNPIFAHLGEAFSGFDLALLPIGLFNPIEFMSTVHSSPWDSVDISIDLKARKSIAMHYGTVRGGLSANYEPIDVPLKELKAACERKGLAHGKAGEVQSDGQGEFVFCDIGQTVRVKGRQVG